MSDESVVSSSNIVTSIKQLTDLHVYEKDYHDSDSGACHFPEARQIEVEPNPNPDSYSGACHRAEASQIEIDLVTIMG